MSSMLYENILSFIAVRIRDATTLNDGFSYQFLNNNFESYL